MDVSELGASFSHVRTKYLFGGTIYPDLDERLYFSKNESEELYNPDIKRREHSIRDLILLAKHEDTALHYLPSYERSSLAHLGLLAVSYLRGRAGLQQDSAEGIRLMRIYIEQGLPFRQEQYYAKLREFKEKKESVDWLLEQMETIYRDMEASRREEKAKIRAVKKSLNI